MSTRSGMAELQEKFLSLVPVEESFYKSDIELLERYQSYSAELLRLSLAGLGVVGYLVTNELVTDLWVKGCLVACIISFGLSAAGALGHRYLSSDGIHYLMKVVRLSQRKTPDEARIKRQEDMMRAQYHRSWMYLRLSCASLAVGALAVAAGFVRAALT